MVRDLRFIPIPSRPKVKLHTVLHWCLIFTNPLNQGCTNSERKATLEWNFCAVASNICGLWVWNLLYVMLLKLHTVLYWCLIFTNPLNQGCTNSERKATLESNFCAVASNICVLWVWNLLYVILLVPRILKGILYHLCCKPRCLWCVWSRVSNAVTTLRIVHTVCDRRRVRFFLPHKQWSEFLLIDTAFLLYRGADKSLARPDWKNNWKFAIFRPSRRSLLSWRPGWTDNLLIFFLSGLQKFSRRSLFPSWSG